MPNLVRWACDLVRCVLESFCRSCALEIVQSGLFLARRSSGDTLPDAIRHSLAKIMLLLLIEILCVIPYHTNIEIFHAVPWPGILLSDLCPLPTRLAERGSVPCHRPRRRLPKRKVQQPWTLAVDAARLWAKPGGHRPGTTLLVPGIAGPATRRACSRRPTGRLRRTARGRSLRSPARSALLDLGLLSCPTFTLLCHNQRDGWCGHTE